MCALHGAVYDASHCLCLCVLTLRARVYVLFHTGESKNSSRHHHSSKKKSKKKHSDKNKTHRHHHLPHGVNAISNDDYFLRATEFRVWLAKKKYARLYSYSLLAARGLCRNSFSCFMRCACIQRQVRGRSLNRGSDDAFPIEIRQEVEQWTA